MNQTEIDDLIFKLNGAAMTVLNTIGHGLREKTYERALSVEFKHLEISYDQQKCYPVFYRNVKIDEYIPDMEIENSLLLDTKVVPQIGDIEIGQMLNYLKISQKPLGLIQNFKHPRLEWRIVRLQPS
ncbi:GxxExxY protein [Coraliomargarita parva]|uniref:GxxExxY protein n=1 Tax=Coraliomargarita parva TaxID=3014050 RepID=UPI0022B561D6|nr:GxxExxY protein [Coraliomargarita parva]